MTGLVAKLIVHGIRKSIRKQARSDAHGVSGGFGLLICILPMPLTLVFGAASWFALHDPDPQDRMTGWIILAMSAAMALLFLHYVSYRVLITQDAITANSWITPRKVIYFHEPFRLLRDNETEDIRIEQGRTRIVVGWTLNGFVDLQNLLIEKERRHGGRGH